MNGMIVFLFVVSGCGSRRVFLSMSSALVSAFLTRWVGYPL